MNFEPRLSMDIWVKVNEKVIHLPGVNIMSGNEYISSVLSAPEDRHVALGTSVYNCGILTVGVDEPMIVLFKKRKPEEEPEHKWYSGIMFWRR